MGPLRGAGGKGATQQSGQATFDVRTALETFNRMPDFYVLTSTTRGGVGAGYQVVVTHDGAVLGGGAATTGLGMGGVNISAGWFQGQRPDDVAGTLQGPAHGGGAGYVVGAGYGTSGGRRFVTVGVGSGGWAGAEGSYTKRITQRDLSDFARRASEKLSDPEYIRGSISRAADSVAGFVNDVREIFSGPPQRGSGGWSPENRRPPGGRVELGDGSYPDLRAPRTEGLKDGVAEVVRRHERGVSPEFRTQLAQAQRLVAAQAPRLSRGELTSMFQKLVGLLERDLQHGGGTMGQFQQGQAALRELRALLY